MDGSLRGSEAMRLPVARACRSSRSEPCRAHSEAFQDRELRADHQSAPKRANATRGSLRESETASASPGKTLEEFGILVENIRHRRSERRAHSILRKVLRHGFRHDLGDAAIGLGRKATQLARDALVDLGRKLDDL